MDLDGKLTQHGWIASLLIYFKFLTQHGWIAGLLIYFKFDYLKKIN